MALGACGSSGSDTSGAAGAVTAAGFSCGAGSSTAGVASGTPPSLDFDVLGDDKTRMLQSGTPFHLSFSVQTNSPDKVKWQILSYTGATVSSGSINVDAGATTATVACSSKMSGYFSLTAQLQAAGVSTPERGSRPAGFASFGVLPDFSQVLPAFPAGLLDSHRFGLQGTNYVQSGVCCTGNGLQPINQDLGSRWVLDSLSMATTEPNPTSVFDPTTWSLYEGLQQGSLARVVTLDGIPAWASTAPTPPAVGSYPPASYPQYQAYTALVGENSVLVQAQYIPRQQKNYYQVTWEPDPGPSTQWLGSDSQFVELYQAAWNGLHSTDPAAVVMGPASSQVSICSNWLNRLAPEGLSQYLDAVACHGYYASGNALDTAPEDVDLPGQMQSLRHTMTQLLPSGEKLFMTEAGVKYPVGAAYTATYPTAQALRQHAEVELRTHLILLGEGTDVSFLFYSADYATDVGYGLYFNLALQTAPYGSPDISPKPAAMAVATMTRLLDTSTTLGALTQTPIGTYGYAFELADQVHTVTALWTHNAAFSASATYQLQVDSPGTSGSVVVIDAMGNASTASYLNGALTVNLTEMPIYVLSANVAALTPLLRTPEGYARTG